MTLERTLESTQRTCRSAPKFLAWTLFYEFLRGLGRDLAKLGDKLHQLEMAMGEFSLQQVRAAYNVKSRVNFQ